MSQISYFAQLKKNLEVVYEGKALGRLLSFAFDAATGNITNVLYSTASSKKKHTLKGVHILRLDTIFEVELATAAEQPQVDLWLPKEQRVFTESGIYLGKIRDVFLDTAFMKLSHLDVVYKVLFFPVRGYLVSRDAIVELKKTKVIVKDSVVTDRRENLAFQTTQLPVMESSSQFRTHEHS